MTHAGVRNTTGSHERGFVLIELMVALAVMAVMAAAAVPAIGVWVDREGSAADDLAALVRAARTEALQSARPITLTVEPDGTWTLEREGRAVFEGRLTLDEAALEDGAALRLRFTATGRTDRREISIRRAEVIHIVRVDRWTGEVAIDAP